jgi:hypothetical protein
MCITHTKQNQNSLLNKSSLITTQEQLAETFCDSKHDSLATSKNPSQNIEMTKTMNKLKFQNTKKTCKHENIMPWNLKSPKMI